MIVQGNNTILMVSFNIYNLMTDTTAVGVHGIINNNCFRFKNVKIHLRAIDLYVFVM